MWDNSWSRSTYWHEIVQDTFDRFMGLLSGRYTKGKSREISHHVRIDYYCQTTKRKRASAQEGDLEPFNHLKQHNVIEYKSAYEHLSEAKFRFYVGRALVIEGKDPQAGWKGKTTLTILTTSRPGKLLNKDEYGFVKIYDWKYKTTCFPHLDVYILIQKEMRDVEGGEPLAFLQVLEGSAKHRPAAWTRIVTQQYPHWRALSSIMSRIDKELKMSIQEYFENLGKKKGMKEGVKVGVKEGVKKGVVGVAQNLLRNGFDPEVVAENTGLNLSQIHSLQKQMA